MADETTPARVHVDEKVDIIMTPELLAELEPDAYQQLLQTSRQPGIRRALLMPDGHVGYGCPVGTVAIAEDWIYPMMAGYDIGCGMQVVISALDADAFALRDVQELMADIGQHVAMGTGQGFGLVSRDELTRYLDGGIPAMVTDGYATQDDLERTEEPCLHPTGAAYVSHKAFERGMQTAGSLGGGNHFLEGQRIRVVDAELCRRWGLWDGQFVVQIHCGSRGLGHQVGTDYLGMATEYIRIGRWSNHRVFRQPRRRAANEPGQGQQIVECGRGEDGAWRRADQPPDRPRHRRGAAGIQGHRSHHRGGREGRTRPRRGKA